MSIRPAIRVFQELVSATPSTNAPFFELCVVGPAYQVVKQVELATLYEAGTVFSSSYKDQISNTDIDTTSVVVEMKDAVLKVWPLAAATLSSAVTAKTTSMLSTVTLAAEATNLDLIKPGDVAVVTIGADTYTSPILSFDVATKTAVLKKNIPGLTATDTPATLQITRPVGGITPIAVPTASQTITASTVGIADSFTHTVAGVVYRVLSGTVLLSYRSLRRDLAADFISVSSTDEIDAAVGNQDIQNPLAVAGYIVLANTPIKFNLLPIESDDNTGYMKALDLLATNEKIYVIVPLTQDAQVIAAYASHCTTMSMPEKSKWRKIYANLSMPETKIVVDITSGTVTKDTATSLLYIKDEATGQFISKNVQPNDYLNVYNDSGTFQYAVKVKDVLNEDVAEIFTDKYQIDATGNYVLLNQTLTVTTDVAVKYEVNRYLSKQGISDAMCTIAQSFKNKRLTLVESDSIILEIANVDYFATGEYLAVAYGALRAGLPPHQGFSTIGIAGIKRVLRSNKFFTDTQLDEMATAGVFWVIQDEPTALPYCYYQTTTDNTMLETREDSCVATVDYVSKYYKDNLKNVLGKFNVNEISVKYVQNVLKDITDKLLRTTYPYIGPVILAGDTVSIKTQADKIIPRQRIDIPFPVNGVDLYLEV